MKNNLNFSLVELEQERAVNIPDESSYLIKTVLKLKQKKLRDLDVENLRILIGQNISLNYLIPLAIDKLREDIMAEGDYFEGDLLQNILSVEKAFWKQNEKLKKEVKEQVLSNHQYIASFETDKKFKQILSAFLDS